MAIRIHGLGGPEVLRWERIPVPDPGPGEVLIRHEAIGLNFADIYRRNGFRPSPSMPAVIGVEAAGVVEVVGPGAEGTPSGVDSPDFQPGDRVAYVHALGAYCERRVIRADRLVRIPDSIHFETAAAAMLKGATAWYLCRTCRPRAGEPVLVHAAAGGMGTVLSQWCRALGVPVIGTAGSVEKARVARQHGSDHVILYEEADFVERVHEITGGEGVQAVFDGVGASTFDDSLECLSCCGMMIALGNASGAVPPFDLLRLTAKSLTLARPSVVPHVQRRENLVEAAGELFGHVEAGRIRVPIGQRFPLAEAARAHRALESRRTWGCTVLLP
jgi:NADPH2:quinone reductase